MRPPSPAPGCRATAPPPERDDRRARGCGRLRRGGRSGGRQRRDAVGKRLRGRFTRRVTTDRVTQLREAPVLGGDRGIVAHLALEFERAHRVELAVQGGVEPEKPLVGVAVGHASVPQGLGEHGARAGEPGHHRADRRLGRFGDLAIREAVDVAHHQRFQKGRGEARDRLAQALAVFKGDELLFRIGRRLLALGQIERVEVGHVADVSHGLAPIARHEGHGGVANDGEKPWLRSIDRNGGESLKRAYRSVLHDVLGVGRAVRQPFGKRIGIIEQGRHDFAEALLGNRTAQAARPAGAWLIWRAP